MCKRAIAKHFGLETEQVKELLKRYRLRERKIAADTTPRPKGRPRTGAEPRDRVAEQAYEINRLKMENRLLRDFCSTQEGRVATGQMPDNLYESGSLFHNSDVSLLRSIQKRI